MHKRCRVCSSGCPLRSPSLFPYCEIILCLSSNQLETVYHATIEIAPATLVLITFASLSPNCLTNRKSSGTQSARHLNSNRNESFYISHISMRERKENTTIHKWGSLYGSLHLSSDRNKHSQNVLFIAEHP